ncbi:MAG: DUF1974 domain-containing protein [Gallionellaceae bacterium]|jgi:hypothetical protein|nr:DUF1974 domain-containing protein [Gallionellaceae bacterium]
MAILTLAALLLVMLLLAFFRATLWSWLLTAIVFIPVIAIQHRVSADAFQAIIVMLALLVTVLGIPPLRRLLVSGPQLARFRRTLPIIPQSEAQDAGTIGWEVSLFSGRPNWRQLLRTPMPALKAEHASRNSEIEQLRAMLESRRSGGAVESSVLARAGARLYATDAAERLAALLTETGAHPELISSIVAHLCADDLVNDATYPERAARIFKLAALDAYPFVKQEIRAAHNAGEDQAVRDFDAALFGHISFALSSAAHAFVFGITGGRGIYFHADMSTWRCYQRLTRYAAAVALLTEAVAPLALHDRARNHGDLFRRMGDALSRMFLCSAALRRFESDGRPQEDLPLLHWIVQDALYHIEMDIDGMLRNFPSRLFAMLLRVLVFPTGRHAEPPQDRLAKEIAMRLVQAEEMSDSGHEEDAHITSLIPTFVNMTKEQ